MKNTIDANGNGKSVGNKPCAMLGAGNLASMLWRRDGRCDEDALRFNIFQVTEENGQVSQTFGLRHIEDLAELVQVLAYVLSEEDWLKPESRDDLSCLCACLGDVLGADREPPTRQLSPDSAIATAVRTVLRRLWPREAASFAKEPSSQHLYRQLVLVDRWLAGVVVTHCDCLPDLDPASADYLGDCPLCGSNDGYLNIDRHHWFICHAHHTTWLAGEDLFSSWRCETPAEWKSNGDTIRKYLVVEPVRPPADSSVSST